MLVTTRLLSVNIILRKKNLNSWITIGIYELCEQKDIHCMHIRYYLASLVSSVTYHNNVLRHAACWPDKPKFSNGLAVHSIWTNQNDYMIWLFSFHDPSIAVKYLVLVISIAVKYISSQVSWASAIYSYLLPLSIVVVLPHMYIIYTRIMLVRWDGNKIIAENF